MHDLSWLQNRREFLFRSANGVGLAALGSLLAGDGILDPSRAQAADAARPGAAAAGAAVNPLAPRPTHFAPRAKSCIFIFLEGAPSQIDLFDPKPKLNKLHGQKLPDSLLANVRFAFIQKETVRLMGSSRRFSRSSSAPFTLASRLASCSARAFCPASVRPSTSACRAATSAGVGRV